MKRCLAVILSVFLLISLTACRAEAAPNGPPPEIVSGAPSQEPTASPEPPQSAETADGAEITPPEPGQGAQESADEPPSLVSQASPDGPVAVESVVIRLDSVSVMKGSILDPDVMILPEDAADKSFTLSSSNESVIRQMYGFWTAVGGGTAALVATASNGVSGVVSVTVLVPLESLSLSASVISMNRGDSIMLTPIFTPGDATDTRVQYSSSDDSIASVSGDGVVRAVGAGAAVIQCTAGMFSASCNVTVTVPVTGISLSIDRRAYEAGARSSFSVQITPEDATDRTFSSTVSGSAITLTGIDTFYCDSSGDATITVTATNGMTASQTVTVIDLVAYANEVFRLTNTERVNAGLEPLSMLSSLTQTAVVRANEIIQVFSHDRPDGRDCFSAYSENNVTYSLGGENIAMGQRSPVEVVRAWMDSVGHRENILKSEFGHLGVGVALDENGRLYWSQNFTD